MTSETKKQLNALSKEVFGTSSKWKKILEQGVAQPYERDREVMVPDHYGGFKKKVFTDKKFVIQRFTVEEIIKNMLTILAERNAKYAAIGAIQTGSTDPRSFKEGDTLEDSDGKAYQVAKVEIPNNE